MNNYELDKTYNPSGFEQKWYDEWVRRGCFKAKADKSKKPFTIVMPPPNITGQLHMGHALNLSLQDVLIRYKRMQGYNALWLPGTDHASIATEVKIVEQMAQDGLTKQDLGREKFLERAWNWYKKYGGRIVEQSKRMGLSCDWDRLAFTMDEKRSRAVLEVFVRLYEKGYIYKGSRIINWCPDCKTALSDAEVDYKPSDSHLWHIKYPVENSQEYIIVATTRPETMLGDTAVAVNPTDPRYKDLIGKYVILPLMNRRIPVIADDYVDKDFGTGAVKITPAHDPNDFEVGQRHNLAAVRVMNYDGTMNELAGKYQGMDRYSARVAIVEDLKSQGLLQKIEPHKHNIGQCYRCDTVIEPIISEQWFVRMRELAKPALDVLDQNKLRFTPKRFEKIYRHWLVNIKDWCISRQLWWGHRIPAYYCDACQEMTVSREHINTCPKCGGTVTQDPDVLDTWFSSALWPFSTLGWPEKSEDLDYFYPSDVLVTAHEIIFFWVVRMVFSGIEFMGKEPFSDVVINGIVRDKIGRKMSKSLGNGVDPLEMIEKYGTDSVRFSLLWGTTLGSDIKFSEDKIATDRVFINKIWNAARFVLLNAEKIEYKDLDQIKLNNADQWILYKWNELVKNVIKNMDKFNINRALKYMYEFIWDDFCDWYIELAKPKLYGADEAEKVGAMSVLIYLLGEILKLIHPILPFVTEEIYSHLPSKEGLIIKAKYPEFNAKYHNAKAYKDFGEIIAVIKSIRELRAEMKVPQNRRTSIYILPLKNQKLINESLVYIEKLGMGKSIEIVTSKPEKCAQVITPLCEVYIPILDLVDKTVEMARLQKELKEAKSELARAQGKLANQGFVQKAPKDLVEQEKAKVEKYQKLIQKIEKSIQELE
ncbi:MAG: valine--tRNA ligase [Clostridiales bacterium]|nr:valine--tRNA ligase [Clostridiales bacterium]